MLCWVSPLASPNLRVIGVGFRVETFHGTSLHNLRLLLRLNWIIGAIDHKVRSAFPIDRAVHWLTDHDHSAIPSYSPTD